jgi:hypothetical protein
MTIWDGEQFEGLLNSPIFQITEPGPLHAPIKHFEIKRDEHQRLILTSRSDADSVRDMVRYPERAAGTVHTNTDSICWSNGRMVAVAKGVTPYSQSTYSNYIANTSERTEKSRIHSIEAAPDDLGQVHQLIEWVANLDTSTYIWPHHMHEDMQTVTTRALKAGDRKLIQTLTESGHSSSECLMLNVAGHEIYVGLHPDHKERAPVGTGFILYQGFVPEEMRRKIRDCLSFAFGRPVVYFGYTLLSEDMSFIGFKATSAYSVDGKMYKLTTLPPAPVNASSPNLIDSKSISRTSNALFAKYDQISFQHISWKYWHGACSPVDMTAAYLGSGIEALQRVNREWNEPSYQTTLLNPEQAKHLRSEFLKIVEALQVEEPLKKVLRDKASGLNSAPQKLMNERFFASLALGMGEEEKSAWQRRNDAAHGNTIDADDLGELIRDTKLLKNMFNRIVLSLSGASSHYIDYYSIGFPMRELAEPVSSTVPAQSTAP